jgi:hypothetical protein
MPESPPPTTAAGKEPAQSKKPDDTSAFKQQRMPSWQPVMSPPWVIGIFLALGIIFVPIGIIVIVSSDSIIEVKERYDHLQTCSGTAGCRYTVPIHVPETMAPPVLIYYQLDNFYQNHRRYAKSRSDLQLAGDLPSGDDMSDCDPILNPGQYRGIGETTSVRLDNGDTFDVRSLVYNPCGLIAWSMFNDSYTLRRTRDNFIVCNGSLFGPSGEPIATSVTQPCEKKNIAWPSDPDVKYQAPPAVQDGNPGSRGPPKYYGNKGFEFAINTSREVDNAAANGWYLGENGHKVPDPTDLDLMVWMRLASLSTFRKLYRRITAELEAGSYEVVVDDRFPVSSFKGKKYIVITTTSWLGGKNHVLGGLYIATGIVCVLLGLAFLAKFLTTPRRVGL